MKTIFNVNPIVQFLANKEHHKHNIRGLKDKQQFKNKIKLHCRTNGWVLP